MQAIPEIAYQTKQVAVFQRTANDCVPARNGKVDPEVIAERKARYDDVIKNTRASFFGFEHQMIPRNVLDDTPEQRETTIEPTQTAQDGWVEHVNGIVNMTLMTGANSWYMSANIPGKPKGFLPYLDPEGVGGYRKRCDEIAAKGYEGFALT